MAKTKKAATKKTTASKTEDPCWKGYEQVGSKTKMGNQCPTVFPKKRNRL